MKKKIFASQIIYHALNEVECQKPTTSEEIALKSSVKRLLHNALMHIRNIIIGNYNQKYKEFTIALYESDQQTRNRYIKKNFPSLNGCQQHNC